MGLLLGSAKPSSTHLTPQIILHLHRLITYSLKFGHVIQEEILQAGAIEALSFLQEI